MSLWSKKVKQKLRAKLLLFQQPDLISQQGQIDIKKKKSSVDPQSKQNLILKTLEMLTSSLCDWAPTVQYISNNYIIGWWQGYHNHERYTLLDSTFSKTYYKENIHPAVPGITWPCSLSQDTVIWHRAVHFLGTLLQCTDY